MGGMLPPAERHSSALLGIFAGLSLLLLAMGDRIPTGTLRGAGAWLFSLPDRAVLFVDRMAAAWGENGMLHARVARLELENQRLRSAGVENAALRQMVGLPPFHGQPLTPAEVLALSGDVVPTAATLSAGRRQQVRVGDAVVTREGLLGRIGEVYASHSRVILLTDPNSAVACEVESTGVLGVLHFVTAPHPRLLLTGVSLYDTVRAGQRVLTSGLSRRYPRGILVGAVTRVGRDASGLTQDIQVEPAARLSRLRHAFITPRPPAMEGAP